MNNTARNILTLTLLASTVSGCGLYSKYEQSPDTEITDNLYSYIEATSDTTSLATLTWQELFTDSYLRGLIEQGLENNTDLNVARLNVDQAQIALKTARLAFLPSLDLSATGNLTSSGGTTTKSYTVAASSSWDIDLFGRLRNAKEQGKVALEQSRAYQRGVQAQLISTIATNYYTLLMLDEQLNISRRTVVAWGENIRVMEALKRAGSINSTSVLQSQATKIALESQIVSLEEQIKLLESSLCTLLKTPAHNIERGEIAQMEVPADLSVGLPLQLLSNRPDVQVAEYDLAQAFYATNEARASLYPSLTLGGSIAYSDGTGAISNPSDLIYSLVASVVQPLFNRGTLRAELNISKSQQEQALLQFNQAILNAGDEVNSALISCQSAKSRIEYDTEQVALLKEALRSAELLMKHGSVNYLEVLTAQISLLQAELSLYGSKFDEMSGVINLYYALGGGTL